MTDTITASEAIRLGIVSDTRDLPDTMDADQARGMLTTITAEPFQDTESNVQKMHIAPGPAKPKHKHKEPVQKRRLREWLQNEFGDLLRTEHRFHPTRMWRFDWAVPSLLLAVEFDGITSHAAHTSMTNVLNDSDKMNEAALFAWVVIRCNSKNLGKGTAYNQLRRAIVMQTRKLGLDRE